MLIIATCMTVFVHSFIPIGPPNTYAYIHYNDHSRKVSACRVFCADAPLQQPQIIILMQGLSMCVCVCLFSTKYKSIDDDTRYCCANYKAKNHIDREVGCESHSDTEHSLESEGQQQDEASAIPCRQREDTGM